jgi:2'-hydroxyisoflavone reductase
MRILIAGGTSFVGRAIAWSALREGHDVTVINRGVTPSDLPDNVRRLVGDRKGDFSALDGLSFDATIDTVAYLPRDVEVLAEAIGGRGGHHIQISSVSAYVEPPTPGATEDTAMTIGDPDLDPNGPVTGETYGPLKAACERAATRLFGTQTTLVRPTFVIGSHDATLRFPYWVERARRGGEIAVPGPRSNVIQYIDARDLGDFVVRIADQSLRGPFHAAGPYPANHFVEMVEQIAKHLAPPHTTIREVSPESVAEAHLDAKFPLWTGTQSENMLDVDNSRALANGLRLRPLEESIDDVVAWWADRAWPAHWLTSNQEAQLLRGAQ